MLDDMRASSISEGAEGAAEGNHAGRGRGVPFAPGLHAGDFNNFAKSLRKRHFNTLSQCTST